MIDWWLVYKIGFCISGPLLLISLYAHWFLNREYKRDVDILNREINRIHMREDTLTYLQARNNYLEVQLGLYKKANNFVLEKASVNKLFKKLYELHIEGKTSKETDKVIKVWMKNVTINEPYVPPNHFIPFGMPIIQNVHF